MFRRIGRKEHEAQSPPQFRGADASSVTISQDGRASLNQDGVVFLHVRRGGVFKSNRIGARIWKGLLDHESLEGIAAQISREYAVPRKQVEQDTTRFLAELETEGFLARQVGR